MQRVGLSEHRARGLPVAVGDVVGKKARQQAEQNADRADVWRDNAGEAVYRRRAGASGT